MSYHILVADDEPGICLILREFLESQDYRVSVVERRQRAEQLLTSGEFDAAVVDYRLPDGNAIELLETLAAGGDVDVPIIVLTAHGSIELAVHAIQKGAHHFLTKPVDLQALGVVLRRALTSRRHARHRAVDLSRSAREPVDPFLGSSPAIRELAQHAAKIAESHSPVLIEGETGTGKSLLARWVHENGPRAEEAFIDINCGGLQAELLDNELFGHERGAFTGASATKKGLLEVAHRGTLFLDEIGDVDLPIQPKLLTVLETKRFRRLGDVRERFSDLRLICATHRELATLIQEGRFRRDLYFRISAVPLRVPALRQRREDVPVLAENLLGRLAVEIGRPAARLTEEACHMLSEYDWPGNIRELRNVLERALLLGSRDELTSGDLNFDNTPLAPSTAAGAPRLWSLAEVENEHIRQVLEEVGHNVSRAARVLGLPRSSLYKKLKELDLAPANHRNAK